MFNKNRTHADPVVHAPSEVTNPVDLPEADRVKLANDEIVAICAKYNVNLAPTMVIQVVPIKPN